MKVEKDYKNLLLLEQKNGDFGDTMMRQFLFDAYRKLLFERLQNSTDKQLAAIAEKSLKETRYHFKHSAEWVIRLGDGTEESHKRIQNSLNNLWRYTDELFYVDASDEALTEVGIVPDLSDLKSLWLKEVNTVLELATLQIPTNNWQFEGGRKGVHSEHMGYLLSELQFMQRVYPNMEW